MSVQSPSFGARATGYTPTKRQGHQPLKHRKAHRQPQQAQRPARVITLQNLDCCGLGAAIKSLWNKAFAKKANDNLEMPLIQNK